MNSITIAGNITKDAESRFLPDGTAVVSFSVADNMIGKDKGAIFWNCSWFGDRATKVQQYLGKGQQVTVIGSVSERSYTDKDGQQRKSMDVRVNDVALQGGKRDEAPRQAAPARAPTPRQNSGGFEDADSGDIPFANPLRGSARCLAM